MNKVESVNKYKLLLKHFILSTLVTFITLIIFNYIVVIFKIPYIYSGVKNAALISYTTLEGIIFSIILPSLLFSLPLMFGLLCFYDIFLKDTQNKKRIILGLLSYLFLGLIIPLFFIGIGSYGYYIKHDGVSFLILLFGIIMLIPYLFLIIINCILLYYIYKKIKMGEQL